MQQLSFRIILN